VAGSYHDGKKTRANNNSAMTYFTVRSGQFQNMRKLP
jgi:hypothetical protein